MTNQSSTRRDIAIGVVVIVIGGIILSMVLSESVRHLIADPFTSDPRAARVVLAVDVSKSMACPLGGPTRCTREEMRRANFDDTRIAAASTWSGEAIDTLVEPNDRLALWTFTTAKPGRRYPPDQWIQEVVKLDSKQAKDSQSVKDRIGALEEKARAAKAAGQPAVDGGTPLYDAIYRGVSKLQSASEDSVRTLVVLTDGDNTVSRTDIPQLEAKYLSPNRDISPVRVLFTAASDEVCAIPRLVRIAERFDGDCFLATDDDQLSCARDHIVDLLRKSQPDHLRTLAEKKQARRRDGEEC